MIAEIHARQYHWQDYTLFKLVCKKVVASSAVAAIDAKTKEAIPLGLPNAPPNCIAFYVFGDECFVTRVSES
jgi:hypothetical protein